MFLYNIRLALRNILKNKGFSFINLIGLSIGMACSLLILVMTYFMLTTDRFHEHYDNLFILQQRLILTSGDYTSDRTGGPVGPGITEAYPQVRQYTRYGRLGEILLSINPTGTENTLESRSFIEENGIAADSNFLKVFSFEMIKGDASQALQGQNSIVLEEELAKKIFQEKDPIGETVYLNSETGFTVTGVLKKVPDNSSIKFSFIAPIRTLEKFLGYSLEGYGYTNFYTYFILDEPSSRETINASINEFISEREEESNLEAVRFLTHIKQAYLFGEQKNFIGILIFGIIGFGILIIACLNYINLSTAKSIERAREVGIRKTGGAGKWQLAGQFLGESLIISIISIHFAILMVELALPKVSQMFDAELVIDYTDPVFWLIIISIILIVGFLAGSYPALLLSSLKPSLILKDYLASGSKGSRLRKVLVVSQFTLTTFFILFTLFLYKQMAYTESADQGFVKDNVMFIPTRGELWNRYPEIKNELLKETSIQYVSSASTLPSYADEGEIDWGKERDVKNTIARIIRADYDFIKTFEMNMAEGRFFSPEYGTDSAEAIVVNREIVSMLEYGDDPVGQPFQFRDREYTIIGVIDDFVFFPIDIGGRALVMTLQETNEHIFLKMREGFTEASLGRIQGIFKKYNPDYPFEYYMMSEYKNPVFKTGDEMVLTLAYFSGFGIFISCLGLFGLALYTVERRTKEIGIRKVFGASVARIITLLSKEFIKLVVIAILIAMPLAYMVLHMILKIFFIKVPLDPVIFILIGAGMVLIAFLTVLWQSLNTARQNPVTSLRYE